jgi:hypothetical protein
MRDSTAADWGMVAHHAKSQGHYFFRRLGLDPPCVTRNIK